MSNLSKLLNRSGALAQQGDLVAARVELEKAVRDHGHRAEPWISLAAIHGMGGNYTEALRCAHKAVELAPNSLQGWVNLANAAQSTNNLPLAVEALQRAHGLPGCPPQVVLDMGLTLAQLDRWAEAEQPLSEYLSLNPGHRETLFTFARVLAKNDKIDAAAALIEEYLRRQPQDADALMQLGYIYIESGRGPEAWVCCDHALKEYPDNMDVLFFKVELLAFEGRLSEAIDTLDHLDRVLPENVRVLNYLSTAYHESGSPKVAIAYARAARKLDPRHVPTLVLLSSILMTQSTAEARSLLEEAETLAPHDLSVQVLKGQLLEFDGDKQGAWECVRTAIKGGAFDIAAAVTAASVAPALGKADEAIELLERLINRPGIPISQQRTLRFALANLCDKAKQHDRAFAHAVIANRLKSAWYGRNAIQTMLNSLRSVYSEAAIATLPRARNRSELPVFIVGMPRSGTSLLEQILSCHSKVHARGETTDIGALANSVPYYPDGVRNLTQEKCDALADAYLQRLSAMAPTALRVTDKLPGNYHFVGLISQLFPGARVVNCRRDPRDICLSNYMIEFLTGNTAAYDLESLALACKDYQELMEHWRRVLSTPILEVRYEDLIADPRFWVAKVLDFCGLEWEDACLNFHKSDRQVITASYDQVRKPLYSTSVARWKHYARHLEPVSRILGLHDDAYP